MAVLMQAFDRICSSDGDQTAFFNSLIDSSRNSNYQPSFQTVGFSELNENIQLITSELHNRHGLRRNGSDLSVQASDLPSEASITEACDPNVLIVSNQPSPGEAAAIMACTQLHIPFVPMALDGPHRTSDHRAKIIINEMKPAVAIVVLCLSEEQNRDNDEDWESKPALSNQEVDIDSHVTISKLNRLGIHRIITVKGQDGSVIGSLAGLKSERSLPSTPIEEDGRDPMYILYTSGSTSRPKAVVQTYAGLWNRIQWQWNVFPFVQQMRRENGLKETVKVLIEDGIVEHGANINDINDVVLRRTSLSFVDSIVEIFGPLLAGVPLYCPLWLDQSSGGQETMKYCGLTESLDLASRDGVRVTRLTCIPSQLTQALCSQKNRQNLSDWTTSLDFIIVSGEACQPLLPKLFDEIMLKKQSILVNLYGQTESSGDVSCMIISASNSCEEKDQAFLKRFPNSRTYVWEASENPAMREEYNFVEKCQKSLIPCGVPITGHKFMLKPIADKMLASSGVGQLFVSGPGLALGYFKNKNEMTSNFIIHESEIWLNTMDLAFKDAKSGTITIVGRAPKGADDAKNGCSVSIGKINGVLIHSAELESIFTISMKKVLSSRGIAGGVQGNVAILFNIINRNGENETKTAVFCNLSRLPIDCCQDSTTCIANSTSTRFNGSDVTLQDIFMDTRSIIHDTSHPVMVPHLILPLNSFPKTGAAGKIDVSVLADMASNYVLRQKISINRNDSENAEENAELSLNEVISIYSDILHVKPAEFKGLTKRSFAEFGGDSLMAITAAHKILSTVKEKNMTLIEENTINAVDLMTLSIQEVYNIISGRQSNHSSVKRQRVLNDGIDDILKSLPSTTLYESDSNKQRHRYLKKLWKAPLQMCVDSSPILIRREGRSLLVVASQGGDLAIVDAKSGTILHRCKIEGKIEGDLNYLVSKRNGTEEIVVFVPTYESKKKMGRLDVFKLCFDPTLTLEKFWSYESDGEIKSKPCVFLLPRQKGEVTMTSDCNGQCREKVLTSSYGGSLSYLDIQTGALLEKKENLGGAIHVDPVVIEDSSSVSTNTTLCVIVASCSWKGKVSCLKINARSLIHLWDIDMWTPIYSTPRHIDSESTNGVFPSLIICGIDGSVRCLDYTNKGDERWRVENSGCRPIFTPCLTLKQFIIFGSYDGRIRCLNVKDGSSHWDSEDLKSPIVSSPVYINNGDNASPDAVVVATTSGNIHALNASTGTLLCRPEDDKMMDQLRLDGEIFCNPICAKPFIYYGCRDSHVYSIRFETACKDEVKASIDFNV